ncbi:MAG: CysS/YqeB C-terminal domain-containing protein, partial [Acidimicrobiales bacterium]
PLLARVADLESVFADALATGDAPSAAGAVLELDQELVAWATETFLSDELDRARSALRSMIVRLGAAAEGGLRDPAEVVGPFVSALLEQRRAARNAKRWADADAVRDTLVALGVEVQDGPEGTTWAVHSRSGLHRRAPIV